MGKLLDPSAGWKEVVVVIVVKTAPSKTKTRERQDRNPTETFGVRDQDKAKTSQQVELQQGSASTELPQKKRCKEHTGVLHHVGWTQVCGMD